MLDLHMGDQNPTYGTAEEANQKGLEVAIDLVKQQVTLASVLIGFALAFTRVDDLSNILMLKSAVLGLVISFVSGILALSIIATTIRRNRPGIVVARPTIQLFAIVQGLSFVTGVSLIALFVIFL